MNCLAIKGIREEIGLSQLEVAKIIGISEKKYIAKETGKEKWMIREVIRLCKLFKIDIESLTH